MGTPDAPRSHRTGDRSNGPLMPFAMSRSLVSKGERRDERGGHPGQQETTNQEREKRERANKAEAGVIPRPLALYRQ